MKKRCFVVAGGELLGEPSAYARLLNENDCIYAADGGAYHVMNMGFWPKEVHGDLDSLSESDARTLKEKGVPIITYPRDKDETDLELVARALVKDGWEEAILIGAWGGRIDQSLASLLVLDWLKDQGVQGWLVTPHDWTGFIQGTYSFTAPSGEGFSLLPWREKVKVHLQGFAFSGNNIILEAKRTKGLSNAVAEKNCTVVVEEGTPLMIRRFLTPFGL